MSGMVIDFQKVVQGSEGDLITVERVTLLPEEARGVAELRRLSEAFKEPELQSYTTS